MKAAAPRQCHYYDPRTFARCPSTTTTVYAARGLDLCAAHRALVRARDANPPRGGQG